MRIGRLHLLDIRLVCGCAVTHSYSWFAESGWHNDNSFCQILNWIDKRLPNDRRPFYLFVDQHTSRFSYDAFLICRRAGIHLIAFPPNLTWLLQPLDVGVHSSMRKQIRKEVARLGAALTQDHVVTVLSTAARKAYKKKNVLAGFRKAGIFPLSVEPLLAAARLDKQRLDAEQARQAEKRAESEMAPIVGLNAPESASAAADSGDPDIPLIDFTQPAAPEAEPAAPAESKSDGPRVSAASRSPGSGSLDVAQRPAIEPMAVEEAKIELEAKRAEILRPVALPKKKYKRKPRAQRMPLGGEITSDTMQTQLAEERKKALAKGRKPRPKKTIAFLLDTADGSVMSAGPPRKRRRTSESKSVPAAASEQPDESEPESGCDTGEDEKANAEAEAQMSEEEGKRKKGPRKRARPLEDSDSDAQDCGGCAMCFHSFEADETRVLCSKANCRLPYHTYCAPGGLGGTRSRQTTFVCPLCK